MVSSWDLVHALSQIVLFWFNAKVENSSNNYLTGSLQDHCYQKHRRVNRFQHAKQRKHSEIVTWGSYYLLFISFFFGLTLIRNLSLTGGSTTMGPTRSSDIASSSQQGSLSIFSFLVNFFFIISSSILREVSPATGDQSTQVKEQSDGQIEELVERVDGRSSMSRHKSLRFKTVSSSIKSQVFTKTRVNISYRLSFHFLQVLHQSSFKDYRSWNITYVWGESVFEGQFLAWSTQERQAAANR